MAEIVIKGSEKEVVLSRSDFDRLFPGVTEKDSMELSKFVDYGLKLIAAKEEGYDTMAILRNFPEDIADDIMVSEWFSAKTAEKLSAFDFNSCFMEIRNQFSWSKPRFKGLIILGLNDSIVNQGVKLFDDMDEPEFVIYRQELTRKVGKDASAMSLLVEQGRNPYVDLLVFGDKIDLSGRKWKSGAILKGGVLNSPETWEDVKDEFLAYVTELVQREIVQGLKEKYTVESVED